MTPTPPQAGERAEAFKARPGYDALWQFFGLSYASWLTLPRVMMHAMPDDWQARMAVLLEEFNDVYEWPEEIADLTVTVKNGNKFGKMPEWLAYKYPDLATIESFKRKPPALDSGGAGEVGSNNLSNDEESV